jgi:hypothetical protein
MPQFLFLGNHWINVDKITSVRFRPDSKTAEDCAVIQYGSTNFSVDLDPEDTRKLIEYLKKNSVQL